MLRDMTGETPAGLSASEAGRLIDEGLLSPIELLEAVLLRIEEIDPIIHSYVRSDRASALRAARESSDRAVKGMRLGPLDGIPFAVKDTIFTRGMATTVNSRIERKSEPGLNATVVARLEAAGAILLGKLNTWEYGTGDGSAGFDLPYPPARNPWNPDYYTGGSSSGSAAAVAAGTATFALGTDTGGSVRLPAAGCGIVGFKPTFGRMSRYGILPNCRSFDTVGPMTSTVRDAALVYDAVAGYDGLDDGSLDVPVQPACAGLENGVEGVRIGRVSNLAGADGAPSAPIIAALERAERALKDAGAIVIDFELPVAPSDYRAVSGPINRKESFSVHETDYLNHHSIMGNALRSKLAAGMAMRDADYHAALRQRAHLIERTDRVFGTVDCLLLPMTYITAPRIEDDSAVRAFTTGSAGSPFSLTGHPALALPAGFAENGLPVSVQLAAGFRADALLLRVARALEKRISPKTTRAAGGCAGIRQDHRG